MDAKILVGDCRSILASLPPKSVDCVVTSPPYFGLRDYGNASQIGLEYNHEAYVSEMVSVFREVYRVLRDDGTLWLNLGDSYAGGGCGARDSDRWPKQSRNDHMPTHVKKNTGLANKSLLGIPWLVAFALQRDGWLLRQEIIWHKPNPMPESVRDRCTKAHEYIFLFSKSPKYFFDCDAIKEPARRPEGPGNRKAYVIPGQRLGENANIVGSVHKIGPRETRHKRSVWSVTVKPFKGAHFATFPVDLVEPCILAGCQAGGTVLDPFGGSGTVAVAANRTGRHAILIELNPEYAALAEARLKENCGLALLDRIEVSTPANDNPPEVAIAS